jgi:hypothetical protein
MRRTGALVRVLTWGGFRMRSTAWRTTAHTAHTLEGIVGRGHEWYRAHQGERGRGFEGGQHSPQILGVTGFV